MDNFTRRLNEADKKIHLVEDQWHYPILTKYNFTPVTPEGVGFVRSYEYRNEAGEIIVCTTGYSSDRWVQKKSKEDVAGGYWADLEPHLKKITS